MLKWFQYHQLFLQSHLCHFLLKSQPPILPLPVTSRPNHRPAGAPTQLQHSYGYRGREKGRGTGHSVARFIEDFDFIAMNEKFKKDQVWGHLGKSNKSHSKDNQGEEKASDELDSQDEDNGDGPKLEIKPVYNTDDFCDSLSCNTLDVYNKDDFFDSLSCNTFDQDSQNGRIRYSEQIKIDTETFGDFTRHRGSWGGRVGCGCGCTRGVYYGRGVMAMGEDEGDLACPILRLQQ